MPPSSTNTDSRDTQDWLLKLDKVITIANRWLDTEPQRSEEDRPSVTAAKQLADESRQFASSIRDAVERHNHVAAYAHLRPLVDRLLHSALFFEDPKRTVDWAYWSYANFHTLIYNVLSQGSANPQDRDSFKQFLADIRRWNQTEDGAHRQMLRPGRYPWADTIGTLTDKAHPGLKSAYNITSTYVHPTYRQLTPEPDIDYLITQAFWITSATIIISAASIAKTDPDFPNCQVDSNLLLLIDAVHQFLTGDSDFSQSTHHPLRDIEPAKKLYVYALMLFSFVYDRDIIEGQPRFT